MQLILTFVEINECTVADTTTITAGTPRIDEEKVIGLFYPMLPAGSSLHHPPICSCPYFSYRNSID